MKDELLSIRVRDTSARDGGWQQMPPALTPRVIVSRRQVLDAHGLTECEIAHLQGLADAAERRRWRQIGDTIIALLIIAVLVWFTFSGGPALILGK